MALAAIRIRWYMIERFTHGGDAIVTGCAVTRYTGMVIVGTSECRGVMAYGAVQRCRNMRCRFASSVAAVVAGGTVIHDTRVIEYCRQESTGHVANAAILRGGEVVGMLAECNHAIMTRRAVVDDASMIKHA